MRLFTIAVLLPVLVSCTDRGGYVVEVKPPVSSSAASVVSPEAKDIDLPLEVDQQAAEAFVRLGFGLNETQRFQSLEFLTPRLRTTQAARLIRLVKTYNEFEGELVAVAVERLRGRVSGVEFGRERSPVLYIDLPYWTHQREESQQAGIGTKISDEDNAKLVNELRHVFVVDLKADEFQVNRRRVRVWWD